MNSVCLACCLLCFCTQELLTGEGGLKIACGIRVQELGTSQRRYATVLTTPSTVRTDIFACRFQYSSYCYSAGYVNY